MKNILFILCLVTFLGYSQETPSNLGQFQLQPHDTEPIFPGCENIKPKKQKECFIQKLNGHIRVNMRYPSEAFKKGIEGRVFVNFIVNTDGKVEVKNVRGPHILLEKEARRIFELLPKMTPGMLKNEPVVVAYSIPITFKLEKTPIDYETPRLKNTNR